MNILTAVLMATVASTPLNRNTNELSRVGNTVTVEMRNGRNYQTLSGEWSDRDMTFSYGQDVDWAAQPNASDWQLKVATDAYQFRTEGVNGTGVELSLDDVSLLWFTPLGPIEEQSLGWTQSSPSPTISGNVWTDYAYPGVQLTLVAGPEGLKSNAIFHQAAVDLIPAPTGVAGWGTAQAVDCYTAIRYRVHDWGTASVEVDGTPVEIGGKWDGCVVEFVSGLNTEYLIPPANAFKNPEGLTADGANFLTGGVRSSIWCLVDRQNDFLYVCVPYQLFIGAETVLIDPPIEFEIGPSDGDMESAGIQASNTDRHWSGGADSMIMSDTTWMSVMTPDLSALPSDITITEATLVMTQVSITGTPNVGIGNFAFSNTIAYSGSDDDPAATGANLPTFSHLNYNTVSWPTALSIGSDPASDVIGDWQTFFAGASPATINDNGTNPLGLQSMVDNGIAAGWIFWVTDAGTLWRASTPYKGTEPDTDRPTLTLTYTINQNIVLDLDKAVASHTASTAFLVSNVTVGNNNILNQSALLTAWGIEATTRTHIPLSVTSSYQIDDVTKYRFAGTFSPTSNNYIFEVSQTEDSTSVQYPVWLGSNTGSFSQVYEENAENLAAIGALQDAALSHIEAATIDIKADISDMQAVSLAHIGDVSGDVAIAISDIAEASAGLGLNISGSETAIIAEIGAASDSVELDLSQVAADLIELSASYTVKNDLFYVHKSWYNTSTTLTSGEFGRSVPADALSMIEIRSFTRADFEAQNWSNYQTQKYKIAIYPDAASGTELLADLLDSATPTTERTWLAKPTGTLWAL